MMNAMISRTSQVMAKMACNLGDEQLPPPLNYSIN